MQRMQRHNRLFLTTIALAAFLISATPLGRLAAAPDAARPFVPLRPVFVIGNDGGFIGPWKVSIFANGRVTIVRRNIQGQGQGDRVVASHQISTDAVSGLLTLTRAEGFTSLPRVIEGTGRLLPDEGGVYISVTVNHRTRTVVEPANADNTHFNELEGVLLAVAQFS